MLRIFIGWDSRFPEPADVLRYSLLKHSSIPLEINYLKLPELGLESPTRSVGIDRIHLQPISLAAPVQLRRQGAVPRQ